MKLKLESILEKGRMAFLTSLMLFVMGCASSRFYVEPKVGLITPISAKEQKYDSSTTFGGSLGLDGKMIGIGASLDYFNSSAEYIKTNSSLLRFNLNLNLSNPESKIRPHLIGGIGFLNESSKIDIPQFNVHDEVTNNTTGLEFGFGTKIFGFDGRATYTIMLGSENVKGLMAFTIGYQIKLGKKK